MSAAESVVSQIQHYQRSIDKYHGHSAKILHCINRLYNLPVSVQHLQDTGIGKTINSLRKSDGDVGESARALVAKWKQMVEEESETEVENKGNRKTQSNGDPEIENHRERSEKRNKDNSVKSKDHDSRESSRSDHSKAQKRRRDSESDVRDKRPKSDKVGSSSSHSVSSHLYAGGKLNGNSRISDDEWNISRHNNGGANSEDETIPSSQIKNERASSEEQNTHFSEDDLKENKSSRTEKTSHKHKHKSSSSNSEKNKHSSSSRSEGRESKSSTSNKHRDEKNASSSSSSNIRKGDVSERTDDKSKTKDKDKKDKHKHKHHSKDEKRSKAKKEKKADADEDGVDSNSGKSFGEALGMMFPPDKPRKKSSSASSSQSPSKKKLKPSPGVPEKRSHINDDMNFSPDVEHENPPLNLEVDEDFGLPALNPNYKPLPQPNFFNSPPKRYQNDDEDDLTNIMYSKVQRTKVFSGNKTGYSHVPSLFDLCTRVLQENIDALEYTGGVPFDLLKPVLERATPNQLYTLEHYNAYLIEDTDIFWEYHCKKDFRNKKREEMETWREMYMRCREEREAKLKVITSNIAASSKAKALPVRKTQLAYVESSAKPPRNIARKQAKYGTGQPSTSSASSPGFSSSFTGRANTAHATGPAVAVPAPRGAGGGGSSNSSSCKPKAKAPLMQKALQLIKYNRYKR
ncbi:hypothetical protein ONE63_006501 [Megalurothrips usitatus]|uniref:TFIIS N-terminal domain-containing protein n=1 Tax=Megalurothrips usitatus TaxID=439358 RepID=A0AAV7XW49_9NEOP|nr:hypothetical protein ONE63_006501 [Megalurothrips usitatus]